MSRNSFEPAGWLYIKNESLIEKNKLPTNRTVMGRYLHMRTENALKPNNDLISALFGELEIVWAKSGIPIKQKKHVTLQLTSLWDEYRKLKKEDAKNLVSSKPTRSKKENTLQTKIKCFQEKLNKLCDISTSDCYQTLRSSRRQSWKTDWAFYENQKTTRTQNINAVDRNAKNVEIHSKKRDRIKLPNQWQCMTDKQIRDAIDLIDGKLDSTDCDEEEDFKGIPSKRKKSSESVSLSLPAKQLSKVMSQRQFIFLVRVIRLASTGCGTKIEGQRSQGKLLEELTEIYDGPLGLETY
ncbi:hypothetical protein OUZ56_005501 [Daphnia magna]|uniref:Cc8K15.2-like protein n=1 Tax=Daphnia magna TaxID=35525 RepID=A0ABQ9YT57_9CRUS|nr:hypothetical protein OUZ56_005501 [Daphnia magna]